jgi:NTE family protein
MLDSYSAIWAKGMGMTGSKPRVALMLQGGGALGAYHIGAYQALAEQAMHPDWIAGISIGAINSAVLAGTPPEERVDKLAALWEAISWPGSGLRPLEPFALWQNWMSNAEALIFGQPNFFFPRPINPMLVPQAVPSAVSFYDTTPMLSTLGRFADFHLINTKAAPRLSLGATNVETGQLEFFDSKYRAIRPEHVLASGSLPPGFAATKVGDRYYWDGGCVSNTPLDVVIDESDGPHTVVFMIDLWAPEGKPPTNMSDAAWRAKQIQYASRTAHHIDAVATKVNLRHAVRLAKQAGVPEVAAVPDAPYLHAGRLDIVHIIYHPGPDQIPNSDAEFSRSSIAERRAAGYADMNAALVAEPWTRAEKPAHLGAMIHRVRDGRVMTLPEPNLTSTKDLPLADDEEMRAAS